MAFAVDDLSSVVRNAFLVLASVVWGVAVIIIAAKGDHVDRANRVPQLYGYTVCLVALVTMLITLPGLVDNFFTLSNPAHGDTRFGFGASLGSFEAYRASQQQGGAVPDGVGSRPAREEPPPSEAELRRRYEALRADQIASNLYDARRSLVRHGILLVLALALFVTHWRWLRRGPGASSPSTAAPV